MSGYKTARQILRGYTVRLQGRMDWLHEKINILKADKRPYGYEQEEFYAIQFVIGFLAMHQELAFQYIEEARRKREQEGRK